MRSLLLVPVVALVVASCGGGGSSSPSYATPQAMAALIGCANPQPATELIAKEAVDCDLASGSVRLLTFNDNAGRDSWVKTAKQLAGGVYTEGDKWVAQVDTTAQAQQIAEQLGGKVA